MATQQASGPINEPWHSGAHPCHIERRARNVAIGDRSFGRPRAIIRREVPRVRASRERGGLRHL